MELFINNKSGAPIYDQIYNQIKQQIISGLLLLINSSIGCSFDACVSSVYVQYIQ